MDEEMKSESNWKEVARVALYQFQEQVPQDDYSQGGLYPATHENRLRTGGISTS
jgi:hypothetical protein